VKELRDILQQFSFSIFIKNNDRGASYFKHCRLDSFAILMLIETGFILNKLCILGAALKEQFFKNLRRFVKVENRDLFSAVEISSLILTSKHKYTALVPHEKASISRRVI
jgi:hypothetical protein